MYDTSGPYTDPNTSTDIRQGLKALRSDWILGRGDVEELASPSYQPPPVRTVIRMHWRPSVFRMQRAGRYCVLNQVAT